MSRLRLAVVSLVALLMANTLAVGNAGAVDRLSIATGGTGGVYYPYGGAMANLLSDNVDGIDVTAEVTAASVDNMLLIDSHDADLAFVLGDTAYDAVQGNEPFKDPVSAVALATLYNNYTHVVTTKDSGINSLADLKGKKVSTGAPGSGTEVIANRMIEVAGLDPDKDIKREQLGASESAAAVKDGKIDAYFWSGGLPTASVTDLGATPNVNLKLIPNADVVDALKAKYGSMYGTATIPAGTYPHQDNDVEVVVVPNILVVNADMDDDLAYNILTAIFEHQADLVAAHPAAKELTLENATKNSPIPYHPAALKFYQDQGVPVATPAASPAA
ncbi:MAG TPA: TAXI family TRAP transporter solute-binding subunit [Thermomicrobiales bacterium]|nr:TAXI family TRAP transporter solute-binding subunit [Thermomicrobiales bacterium]